jgi:hypothetical protein
MPPVAGLMAQPGKTETLRVRKAGSATPKNEIFGLSVFIFMVVKL